MFGESSSAKSRRFPWINLAFYRGRAAMCKKATGKKNPRQPKLTRVLVWSGREDLNLYEPTVE
ncbi:hypothetical protein [Burkholderia cepacia]|uniref:hypothetical protein n=1 Tax=Burkholderia cepacia TaxID=292 RepID=UPI0012966F15|nr:hypothetical protein [Burkholderia cepacia]